MKRPWRIERLLASGVWWPIEGRSYQTKERAEEKVAEVQQQVGASEQLRVEKRVEFDAAR